MTVVIVARWTASQESIDEVLTLIGELVAQSRAEPGCLGYDVYRVVDEPSARASEATGNGSVVLIETYRDADAQVAHRNSEHFQGLVLGRIVPLLVDRRVEQLTPLS